MRSFWANLWNRIYSNNALPPPRPPKPQIQFVLGFSGFSIWNRDSSMNSFGIWLIFRNMKNRLKKSRRSTSRLSWYWGNAPDECSHGLWTVDARPAEPAPPTLIAKDKPDARERNLVQASWACMDIDYRTGSLDYSDNTKAEARKARILQTLSA